MTEQQCKQIVSPMKETLLRLHMRWLDEKEYEDFADYEKVMREKFDSLPADYGVTFVKGSKRPFGLVFAWNGEQKLLSITTREITIKPIIPRNKAVS